MTGRRRKGRENHGRRCVAAVLFGAALATNGVVVPIANATTHARFADLASITPADLVADLVGHGTKVANVEYTGDPSAASRFSDVPAVGFGSGIVLSTGRASEILAPNRSREASTDFKRPGDADLEKIAADQTHDAAVLSFDIVPSTNTLDFSYVFASEEYDHFVNTPYNDVFEFLVNGRNCAVTPDGQAVSVDQINDGNPTGDPTSRHADLYRANRPDPKTGITPFDLRANGLTRVLHCTASVERGRTAHVKLAVADVGDGAVDTAVFIKASSVHSNHAPVARALTVATTQGLAVPVTLAATDKDDDALGYRVVSSPEHGTLTGLAPDLLYTPAAGYAGDDSFTYVATDGSLDSSPASVTVRVTPLGQAGSPHLDLSVSADDGNGTRSIRSPQFSTSAPNELLLAFVAADGPQKPVQQVDQVTGGGLGWTLVRRANQTWGTAEIWQATASTPLTDAVVEANFAKPGVDASITVAAFSGAVVGTSNGASGTTGRAAVTLPATADGSLAWSVGHNWSWNDAPVLTSREAFVHAFSDDGSHDYFWVSQLTAPVSGGTAVDLGDTRTAPHRWQLVAVEIRPAQP